MENNQQINDFININPAGLQCSSSPLLFFLEYQSVLVYFFVHVRIESIFVRNMQEQNSILDTNEVKTVYVE